MNMQSPEQHSLKDLDSSGASAYIVVAGAQNMDISGHPDRPPIYHDSNPGMVRMSVGGVGRNIAHNLALLGESVTFISAFGGDLYGEELRKSSLAIGLDISHSLKLSDSSTSVYLFVTDEHGEMELAVSDMKIYEQITPDYLAGKQEIIDRAALCVADMNLTQEALDYLARNSKSPLFVDTVSTVKSQKIKNILGHIHTIKTNSLEAEALTGISAGEPQALVRIADYFLSAGLKQVFISLGTKGIYCADENEQHHIYCYSGKLINSTGAGDCLMAALAWSRRQGYSLKTSALAGLAAASICIESTETVNPLLTKDAVRKLIELRLEPDEGL